MDCDVLIVGASGLVGRELLSGLGGYRLASAKTKPGRGEGLPVSNETEFGLAETSACSGDTLAEPAKSRSAPAAPQAAEEPLDRVLGTANANPAAGLLQLDITDAAAAGELLGRLRPRCVIHTAALTDVNLCEVEAERSRAINVVGTVNVARAAAAVGARYLYFSSDYVFGGDHGPHPPGEAKAPMNVYGAHKAEAEELLADCVENYLIIRGCNLYGYQEGGKNFAMAVFELGRQGKSMRVAVDQWGNPTLARDMARAVSRLIDSSLRGAIHLAGPDHVSRYDWARRAARAFDLDEGFITGLSSNELSAVAPRPAHGGLDAGEAERELGMRFVGLDEGLAVMRADLQRAGKL